MFSSLASYFFGTNTENPNSEAQQQTTNAIERERQQQQQQQEQRQQREDFAGDVISVTSATPSVTGGNPNRRGAKRGGKNRRSGFGKQKQGVQARFGKTSPTITKLLTPNESSEEDDFDEAEWFIVEKEDEEISLPCSDSEEDISLVEVQQQQQQHQHQQQLQQQEEEQQQRVAATTRRRQHISSHSLYSGPRPQQQRNYLQRVRNGVRGTAITVGPLSQSAVNSPPTGANVANGAQALCGSPTAENGVTQSLYAVRTSSPCVSDYEGNASSSSSCGVYIGADISMEESWYVTPPPCFTSIGPINMEISPFENLLIEHPSMSVYHSIRSAQEATESFVSLDLGVNNEQQQQQQCEQPVEQEKPPVPAARNSVVATNSNNARGMQTRAGNNNVRIDRQAAAQLKQEALALRSQKSKNKKDHQMLCRGAIKRSNKVREYQAKSNRSRRSDMQHCKLNSGANNNRKCCF